MIRTFMYIVNSDRNDENLKKVNAKMTNDLLGAEEIISHKMTPSYKGGTSNTNSSAWTTINIIARF